MEEAKYYCKKCDAEIKPTDTKCFNCRSDLKKVGRRITVTLEDRIAVSDELITRLSKEEMNIIEKVRNSIKNWRKYIDSITFNFPPVSVTIKIRKNNKNN